MTEFWQEATNFQPQMSQVVSQKFFKT